MSLTSFRHALEQEAIDLAHTALLLSQSIASPQLDIAESLNAIAAMANRARASYLLDVPKDSLADRLVTYLYHVEKLHGNSDLYHDPHNSFLDILLQRRLGIPISLSVLFIAVAQRLGMDAFGVGLPGHFIVGVRQGDAISYIDPYHGKSVTSAECANLVRATTGYQGEFRDEWLRPTANRDIILRMLNNLRLIYMHRQDWNTARKVLLHIDVVRPNLPDTQRDLGLIAFANKDYRAASRYLDRYLSQNPKAKDAPILKRTVGHAIAQWARQN